MKQTEKWAKQNSSDVIWWKQEPIEERGVIFSFDQVKEYNMLRDYPGKLTFMQKETFDRENPFWQNYFEQLRTRDTNSPVDIHQVARMDSFQYMPYYLRNSDWYYKDRETGENMPTDIAPEKARLSLEIANGYYDAHTHILYLGYIPYGWGIRMDEVYV